MRHTSILKLTTLMLIFAIGAWACCTESPLLQFGPGVGTGLKCPGTSTDAALGCGLSPNPTPLNHLDVYYNLSGGTDLDMFRLIIGVPVASQVQPGAPKIDAVNTYNPGHSTVLNGTDVTANFCGYLSGNLNPYAVCGSAAPDGGNTFAAWSTADDKFGVHPNYFALYYYNLDSLEPLDAGGKYDVLFQSNLAVGTMEIAYGCASTGAGCPCYYTPFNQAGQATPEPSSWLLVSGAAIGIMLSRFRITRKKKS